MEKKEINISALPLIGTGRTAEIYAIDEKLALKLYHRQIPRENTLRNYCLLQASKEAGIPVPAVYEMIETCGRDGMIMDLPQEILRERTLECDQLEIGKKYEMVVTNLSGLYRYRIGDVVQVNGYEGSSSSRSLFSPG